MRLVVVDLKPAIIEGRDLLERRISGDEGAGLVLGAGWNKNADWDEGAGWYLGAGLS